MNDTLPQIAEKMRELISAKTPEERLKMGCSMYDFSRRLVIHSILKSQPHLSTAELNRELFLRFYGNDFNPAKRQEILGHLS